MSELTKEDLIQLEADIKVIKEHYLEELEREKSERTLQATKDSELAQLLAEEAVKEAESKRKEQEARASFQELLLKSVEKLDTSEKNGQTNKSITALNTNIEKLITLQEDSNSSLETSSNYSLLNLSGLMIIAGSLALIFFSKSMFKFIKNLLFY